ncbi:MAG: nitrilase family protein [Chitinophagaceae bacterium]
MSSLTVTLIQSQLHWEDKAANLRMFEEKIGAIRDKTEMVVLPEMFSTGFNMKPEALAESMDGPTIRWMQKIAAERRIILAGSAIIKENGNYYNRLIWMLPVGQYGYYDKRHRFAFAGEDQEYTAGNKRLIASVKGWKLNLQICYDLRFPVWARQQTIASVLERKRRVSNFDALGMEHPEFDVLVYVANWPESRGHAWKTLLQARAIENQCYVIGVNRVGKDGNGVSYSGDSMVIDPLGEVMHQQPNEESIITISLQRDKLDEIRNKYPFWRDADHFMIIPNDTGEEQDLNQRDA